MRSYFKVTFTYAFLLEFIIVIFKIILCCLNRQNIAELSLFYPLFTVNKFLRNGDGRRGCKCIVKSFFIDISADFVLVVSVVIVNIGDRTVGIRSVYHFLILYFYSKYLRINSKCKALCCIYRFDPLLFYTVIKAVFSSLIAGKFYVCNCNLLCSRSIAAVHADIFFFCAGSNLQSHRICQHIF